MIARIFFSSFRTFIFAVIRPTLLMITRLREFEIGALLHENKFVIFDPLNTGTATIHIPNRKCGAGSWLRIFESMGQCKARLINELTLDYPSDCHPMFRCWVKFTREYRSPLHPSRRCSENFWL